jgi:hypothetical protein
MFFTATRAAPPTSPRQPGVSRAFWSIVRKSRAAPRSSSATVARLRSGRPAPARRFRQLTAPSAAPTKRGS